MRTGSASRVALEVERSTDQDQRAQGIAVLGLGVEDLGPVALGLAERVTVAAGVLRELARGLAQVALLPGQGPGLLGEPFAQLGHGHCSTPGMTREERIAPAGGGTPIWGCACDVSCSCWFPPWCWLRWRSR